MKEDDWEPAKTDKVEILGYPKKATKRWEPAETEKAAVLRYLLTSTESKIIALRKFLRQKWNAFWEK